MKEFTNKKTRIKELIEKRYGYFNKEAIERIADATKIFESEIIDIIENNENDHSVYTYIKIAIELDTNVEYLIGITNDDKSLDLIEDECLKYT